jgi:Ca2+-binding RTX toxin-like protein
MTDIFGTPGNDNLRGTGGDNRLFGGAGNDALFGLAGNDRLVGGSGNDILVGTDPINPSFTGDEADTLIGGSGADRFVLGNGAGVFYAGPGIRSADIRDFRSSDGDKITLKGSASDYILNTGFTPNGTAIFTVNGQSLIAEVQGVTNLSFASDFVFV